MSVSEGIVTLLLECLLFGFELGNSLFEFFTRQI
jgi:hypothetical protein